MKEYIFCFYSNVSSLLCACRTLLLFFKVRVEWLVYPRPQTAIKKSSYAACHVRRPSLTNHQRWTFKLVAVCPFNSQLPQTSRQDGLSLSEPTFPEGVKAIHSAGRRGYALDIPSSDSKKPIKRSESPFFLRIFSPPCKPESTHVICLSVLNEKISVPQAVVKSINGRIWTCSLESGVSSTGIVYSIDNLDNNTRHLYWLFPDFGVFWKILPS